MSASPSPTNPVKASKPRYPRRLPTPTLRKGGLTYEFRVRVPPDARGGRFQGSHTSRSLGTRDKAEAFKRLPSAYERLQEEFAAEAALLTSRAGAGTLLGAGEAPRSAPAPEVVPSAIPTLTVEEVCRLYRSRIIGGERVLRRMSQTPEVRQEIAPTYDPIKVAEQFSYRVKQALAHAKAEAMLYDYRRSHAFLNLLEEQGVGRVVDRDKAVRALARTHVQALRSIIADDEELNVDLPPRNVTYARSSGRSPANTAAISATPKLSEMTAKYIEKRGDGLTKDRADAINAAVRDLISVTADLPVDRYTASHAEAFEEVMRALPANWMKREGRRSLTIRQAATKASALGMERQKAKTLRQKWSDIGSIFKHASIKYPLHNPFIAQALLIEDKKEAANAQKTPFDEGELSSLLASKLPGNLHWMTWLGLYTGARLNEICQLSTRNFRTHGEIDYIYFSPEMRLKTGDIESCVRSIPLHPDLIQKGLLDYVASCEGLLFPGLPRHRSGRYSDSSSKAFRRHLQAIGIKRPKLSFHSLRHNFSAALKRYAPRDVETRERLLGHADSSVAGRYGNDYEAEAHDMVLLEERAKVLRSIKFRLVAAEPQ